MEFQNKTNINITQCLEDVHLYLHTDVQELGVGVVCFKFCTCEQHPALFKSTIALAGNTTPTVSSRLQEMTADEQAANVLQVVISHQPKCFISNSSQMILFS